jgi:NAD(P)-dependent dehydrogenase (short-subunit alcohol dehydrogenase family)
VATDFAGKTALITGAGRGIGRAVALGLAGTGAHVVLLARTAEQLDETRALLLERGCRPSKSALCPLTWPMRGSAAGRRRQCSPLAALMS